MKDSKMESIRKRIDSLPPRSVFVVSDFTDICDYQNAKKCLLRLQQDGLIRRVIRGVYDKPYFSPLLGEESCPNIEETAKAIARNFSWQIVPTGITSLNILGLSTQVAAHHEYFSSGPYKTYDIGGIEIRFLHRSSRETLGLSYESALVVSAIKQQGPNIGEGALTHIGNCLGIKEKKRLLSETKHITKWIYEIIKIICT